MPYVELHAHSAYSFLDGASLPVELAAVASEQDYPAMALTDHDGLHGAMEFAQAAKPLGLRPITGAELTLEDGSHLTFLCESRQGYRNLCLLITRAHEGTRERPAEPTPPSVSLEEVERHAEGLVCLSGCARDGALAGRLERHEHPQAAAVGKRLLRAFGPERFRVELQRPFARHDRRRNRLLSELAERLGVPCVATGNVHAHTRSRVALQDAFVAARLGTTLDESEPQRRGNTSHVLASPEAMSARFPEHPEAVHESGRLAERLEFDITRDLGYRYPGSEDGTADSRLAELCSQRLEERYRNGGHAGGHRARLEEARARLEEELRIIRALKLSGFFLLHRDMLELAREVAVEVRGTETARALLPPGRGRGSSVSSIVCYLTGLSHIDPIENRLLMGRFLNEEISSMPDIDLDCPRDIREVLIPRVIQRYGEDRAALVSSFACYRTRGAVRDFAKALGLPPGEVERAARSVDPWSSDEIELDMEKAIGGGVGRRRIESSPRWRALVRLVQEAHGLPRHVSQHPGGMVIATEPLCEICPIQPAAMTGRQLVQWDKDSCSDAGFLKIDFLGLGMLSAVERCIDEVARVRGERIDLSRIPFDDPQVFRSIQQAKTTGVFQIESRAQMQMLVQTLPETLDDLTVQVALVRPGPILGGAVHPYIERRKRLREDPDFEVPYEHPCLEPVLRDTLGTIVFQDQVIETSMAFAGFSAGEAEGLRRAMSRRRSEEAMRAYERKFVEGAVARGATRESAERMYGQIVGFSGFGFPKAHSAAFGLLAYQSTWLREHYGPEFLCGLLNEQPMGFYPPDALVHEAQRRGMEVLPPDALRSDVLCRVEPCDTPNTALDRHPLLADRSPIGDVACGAQLGPDAPQENHRLAVRIGLGYVLGVREADVRGIVDERERSGPFGSLADLAARCAAQGDALERLAWAGACDSLCSGRREALWLLGVSVPGTPVRGGTQLALPLETGDAPSLRDLTPWERMLADYGSTHVTLKEHPLELIRPSLPDDMLTSVELEQARSGRLVRLAGLVVARQRPSTANGVTFMLLEDEFGTINLIVPPPIYDRFRLAIRSEPLITASGRLERRSGTTNVIVDVVSRLERPDVPQAEVRHIEPRRTWSTDDADELRAVAPVAHSFGRRGR
ncbi:MAG: DNA polymerase III subunit alpha [Thermoleophilaceae bacterium]